MKYIIKSLVHPAPHQFFVAVHGYNPLFAEPPKARRFDSAVEADTYAFEELFTSRGAFAIVGVADETPKIAARKKVPTGGFRLV